MTVKLSPLSPLIPCGIPNVNFPSTGLYETVTALPATRVLACPVIDFISIDFASASAALAAEAVALFPDSSAFCVAIAACSLAI